MAVMTARTLHRIANTQAQPVRLTRTRTTTELLPNRHGEYLEQGSGWPYPLSDSEETAHYGQAHYGQASYGDQQ